jgi:formylglycine-generating enzyme required for sulfatase activity
MTGLGSRFLLFAFLCLTLAAPAHAEKRVALIIGNGFYQYQPILTNPKHDAEDVAKALGDLNFDVVLGLDLTRAGMNEKLDEFSRKADGADIAFVYYSGHGMQLGGSNYLLPTDASLDSAADVNPFRLLRIDNVMETLSAVNGPKIVVLDACRDNPVANELKRKLAALRGTRGAEVTRGLSPISGNSGSGLLVAYATQADETALDGKGRNSPFTAAFIKNVGDPDTDIRQMFFHVQDEVVRETDGKQRPEISVSLVGEYKLKITITPVKPGETLPPAAPVAGGPGEAERTWVLAKDTNSQDVLEDFIRRFPESIYAKLAREKLEELKKSQVAIVSPPAAPTVREKAAEPSPSNKSEAAAPPFVHLSPDQERALKPPQHFKECDECPEMVTTPPGSFLMGSPASEAGRETNEGPQQQITLAQKFAVGLSAVTFDEWNACVAEGGCNAYRPGDYGWGHGKRPVINISWEDAQAYVKWLSQKTGAPYRLLSEAEHEYVTRGCNSPICPSTPFWFGAQISPDRANYDWRYSYNGSVKADPPRRTIATDASVPNPFGLLQVHGNVREWVEDCWNETLAGIPRDGIARMTGDCTTHVLRNGSWKDEPKDLRSAKRGWELANERRAEIGFRVARTLRN